MDIPAVFDNHGKDYRWKRLHTVSETVSAAYGTGGNNTPFCVEPLPAIGIDAYNQSVTGEVAKPLTSAATDTDHTPAVLTKVIGGALTSTTEN